jgi:hypothetical protein
MTDQHGATNPLPACVTEYIDEVIRRMRYSARARREVRQELTDHFTDALADCPDPTERQQCAEELVAEFGDTKVLGALLRRAKKRNRPAWLKAFIRSGQGLLVLLVVFGLYTAWFMTGRPTISTNYVAALSEKLQPKAPESENAWPFYRRAALEFVATGRIEPPDPTQPPYSYSVPETDTDLARMPEFVQAGLRKWVDENEAAWQSYLAASRKPYCWYSYAALDDLYDDMVKLQADRAGSTVQPRGESSDPEAWVWKDAAITILLPHVGPVRRLSRIGVWKSRLALADGDPRQALDDMLAVASVGRHWQDPNRFIIEQLVGVAINSLACDEIGRLAADGRLTATDLQRAQETLEALHSDGYPAFGTESERMNLADTIQRVFTEGGPGGGHPIPRFFGAVVQDESWRNRTGYQFSPGAYWTAASLVHAGRDDTLSALNAYYDEVAKWSSLTPYQQRDLPDPDEMIRRWATMDTIRYQILYRLLPSLSRASENVWRGRAEYEATLTVLALQRYRLDMGQYPPDLGALVHAGYLRQVPKDPYSDGPLVYRSTGDAFTLYSVARNFQDDGGAQNPDDPWQARQAGSATPSPDCAGSAPASQPSLGDRVFWPVAPLKPYPADPEWQ